ncbi:MULTISPECIES: bacterial proteasome activator family protein [Kitasatospora]
MTKPMNERSQSESYQAAAQGADEGAKVLIVGPDGLPIGAVPGPLAGRFGDGEGASAESRELPVTEMVEQPAKVMRIGSMIKQLLEEVRAAPLDEASRARLKDIHASSIKELELGLAPELVEELERLSLPFTEDSIPTEAELRIAQAQLVGWLEGLFHGIQTALFAQQMAARAQLEQMRRALPPGSHGMEPEDEESVPGRGIRSGPYL